MSTDDPYDRMRHDFEDLEVDQQARFLIEASASTLARGVEEIGRALADGLEDVMGRGPSPGTGGGSAQPGPAEPETAQRQAPTNHASADE